MRKHEEEVLEWTNEVRKEYNLGKPLTEMPPDLTYEQYIEDGRSIVYHCPMAVALNQVNGCGVGIFALSGQDIFAPSFVREFMIDHDRRFGRETRARAS